MPKMTAQQIVEVITSDQHPNIEAPLSDLVGFYANRLAAISGKLEKEEMADFLGIGVALYQRGLKEFQDRSDTVASSKNPSSLE
jgi:hypothetical protein